MLTAAFKVLSDGQEVDIVLESCESRNTYRLVGNTAVYVGEGDNYTKEYLEYEVSGQFVEGSEEAVQYGGCNHVIRVIPTASLVQQYKTRTPALCAATIVAIFAFAGVVFIVYDYFVTSRQHRTEKKAETSDAIVQELFPGKVAAQLYADSKTNASTTVSGNSSATDGNSMTVMRSSIAQFYPSATVLFADIAGKSTFQL